MSWYTTDEITFPENFPFFSFFHFPILKNLLHMTSTNSCECFLEAISTVAVTNILTHTHTSFFNRSMRERRQINFYISPGRFFLFYFSRFKIIPSVLPSLDLIIQMLCSKFYCSPWLCLRLTAGECKSNSCKRIFFFAD